MITIRFGTSKVKDKRKVPGSFPVTVTRVDVIDGKERAYESRNCRKESSMRRQIRSLSRGTFIAATDSWVEITEQATGAKV